ncbi:MAG: adenylate/guanylate cyclase domain-containing protein [Treponema sp.]|nr:adenylate/guanylate cyclase domain-containing protein [Treponema sp.]
MKKYLKIIIAFLNAAVCSLLIFTSVENRVADFFQRFLPSLKESKNVVMVNVDDASIENIGTWPFSRDVYAESLITLKELGAQATVFDLSFLDKSPAKVDEKYVNETLPAYVNENFANLHNEFSGVIDSVSKKKLSPSEAKNTLSEYSEQAKNNLNTSISYVIRSQDALLANGLTFFNSSFLTLTADNYTPISDEYLSYLENFISLKNVVSENDTKTPDFTGGQPAIQDLMTHAKGAGFVNANPDSDGYLRRLNLLVKINGKYYGQLMLVPLLAWFENPQVVISNSKITIKEAKVNGKTKNIVIPRDRDGSVIVKYPKKHYADYNQTSLWNIYRLSLLDKELFKTVSEMQASGLFEAWEGDNPEELYNSAQYIKESLFTGEKPSEEITYDLFSAYRTQYANTLSQILSEEFKEKMMALYQDDPDSLSYIAEYFDYAITLLKDYQESFNSMKEKLEKAFCIVGTTATSTTDYGLNQYEEHYPNPGVHYTIANQILSEDFVKDNPVFITILIAFILSLLYGAISCRMESIGKQIVLGIAEIALTFVILAAFFVATRSYLGAAIPICSLLFSFVGITIWNLLTTSKDKKFIKSAFSQCLAPAVVDEIVKNPSSFKLGGQTIDMTAIFTDIQKFSGFSELLSAAQLVALLNFYLTRMSDIIMNNRGTVDKYEGDAIVAFVGAPVKTPEHAALACRAAVNMKKAEREMNLYIEDITTKAKPEDMDSDLYEAFCIMVRNKKQIFTRIGLNSGEIVAGYMGSTNKKNYTVMGNNVNLASRLEGVNKQYRTGGILMSEATRKGLDDNFIVRSLDRVQVVNVVTPIRLYELMDLRENAGESLLKYVDAWEKTMKLFESEKYEQALECFKKLSEARPTDNVAKYYIELIEKFFIKGGWPTEKDDFGVAYNAENPKDMKPEWEGTPYEIKGTFKLLQK